MEPTARPRKVLKMGMLQRFLSGCATYESAEYYTASKARRMPELTDAQLVVFIEECEYVDVPTASVRAGRYRNF